MDKQHKIEEVEAKLDGRKWQYKIPEKRHFMFLLSMTCTTLSTLGFMLLLIEEHRRPIQSAFCWFIVLVLPPLYTATKYLCE